MWIQAATTMSVYQAVSSAAVAMAPHGTPAPKIADSAAAEQNSDPNDPFGLAALLQQ
jgi:PPE-repeat protein